LLQDLRDTKEMQEKEVILVKQEFLEIKETLAVLEQREIWEILVL